MAEAEFIPLTYDDYCLIPEDGKRHELIEGEHYVTPAPSFRHQRLVAELTTEFSNHFRAHGGGLVLAAPFDVLFSNIDVVQPDLVVILEARHDILTPAHARGAPDLVVEVLSPSTRKRDLTLKRKLYFREGLRPVAREEYANRPVQKFWALDPEAEWLHIYRDATSAPEEHRGASLSPPILPGFTLDLAALFGRL